MFSQKSYFDGSRVDFQCFVGALGRVFLTFSALETGLKIDVFQGHSGDPEWHQEIKGPAG